MDDETQIDAELHSLETMDEQDSSRDQFGGAFFPQAQHFVVAGGNFRSVTNITQVAPDLPSVLVRVITYTLRLASSDSIAPGYLFLCPLSDLQADSPSRFRFAECPAFWSLNASGAERLSMEEAERLGFPSFELEMWIDGRSWDESVYNGTRQFHQGKGFDPDSQDVSRELGRPLYEISKERGGPFAHIQELDVCDDHSAIQNVPDSEVLQEAVHGESGLIPSSTENGSPLVNDAAIGSDVLGFTSPSFPFHAPPFHVDAVPGRRKNQAQDQVQSAAGSTRSSSLELAGKRASSAVQRSDNSDCALLRRSQPLIHRTKRAPSPCKIYITENRHSRVAAYPSRPRTDGMCAGAAMCADAPDNPKRGRPFVKCAPKAKSSCREGDSKGRRIEKGGVRGDSGLCALRRSPQSILRPHIIINPGTHDTPYTAV
ncbi:hypothetical protein B0H17DRAFT_1213062 [Mycena rosella]|uniref:Uncharacterized protein n=1 Tax=Mycena rosella TaxID=1033263 RepID=A0AAD7CRP2_MYCRO|nr:hypothetical protein B0H17DRAFT_1213062 [Mycena rosella]